MGSSHGKRLIILEVQYNICLVLENFSLLFFRFDHENTMNILNIIYVLKDDEEMLLKVALANSVEPPEPGCS